MSRTGALWIGCIEPYMDEQFLEKAVAKMGVNNLVSVKVIYKFTGDNMYGFLNFENDAAALLAMHKMNGKIIPNSHPPIRFKLNHNNTRLGPGEKELSVWVGDLSEDVDDLQLFRFFAARFQSIKFAKVVLDAAGISKGYGFIRFGNAVEQDTALSSMGGVRGLGSKSLRIGSAVPKGLYNTGPSYSQSNYSSYSQPPPTIGHDSYNTSSSNDAASASYYNQYWSQYAAWNQYSQQQQHYDNQSAYASSGTGSYHGGGDGMPVQGPANRVCNTSYSMANENSYESSVSTNAIKSVDILHGPSNELVDHNPRLDYDALDKQFFLNSEDLWSAINDSRWISVSTI